MRYKLVVWVGLLICWLFLWFLKSNRTWDRDCRERCSGHKNIELYHSLSSMHSVDGWLLHVWLSEVVYLAPSSLFSNNKCNKQHYAGVEVWQYEAVNHNGIYHGYVIFLSFNPLCHIHYYTITHTNRYTQRSLINWLLKLACACLSFDFIGTSTDESGDDLTTVQIPTSWRSTFLEYSTMQLFFNLFHSLSSELAAMVRIFIVLWVSQIFIVYWMVQLISMLKYLRGCNCPVVT